MIELVYISKATISLDSSQVHSLLSRCRMRNQSHAISGLLLYDRQLARFIQVLEGDAESVQMMFGKIQLDPRQSEFALLGITAIHNRSFNGWQMGYINVDKKVLPAWPGLSDFLQLPAIKGDYAAPDLTLGQRMLLYFREQSQKHNLV